MKAGTVLNFIPAFSYFSTEAITCVVKYIFEEIQITQNSFSRIALQEY